MRASFHRAVVLATLTVAGLASAEKAAVNVHLDPGLGTGLDKVILVTGATLKIDTTLIQALGPVAPQIEGFGLSAVDHTYLDDGVAFGVGLGARLRLFNDEKGYYFNPGSGHLGNLWGTYWLDAHVTYTSGGFGVGFDVGTGYEFSLVDGLGIGPFAKFLMNTQHAQLMFGLSFTVGAPQTTPTEADYDNDGILGDNDKCIDEAGPKENGGCPDQDGD
ncbi:MAG: hypothetical protein JNG84_00510, partial [Archangium sp.]|nr:hypothetical protein [Archangium sp.]